MHVTGSSMLISCVQNWFHISRQSGPKSFSTLFQVTDSNRHLSPSVSSGTKLDLSDVSRSDAGVFTCTAYNGVGQRVADKILLRVQRE